MRRKNTYLVNMQAVSYVLIGVGLLFLLSGLIPMFTIRPGVMVTINNVRRPATAEDVRLFQWLFGGIFGVVGGGMALTGWLLGLKKVRRRKEIARLQREGELVMATVIDCQRSAVTVGSRGRGARRVARTRLFERSNDAQQLNRTGARATYYLRCAYEAPDGKKYVFTSDLLRDDPTALLEENQAHVYCDRVNHASYFVDVDASVGLGSRVFEV